MLTLTNLYACWFEGFIDYHSTPVRSRKMCLESSTRKLNKQNKVYKLRYSVNDELIVDASTSIILCTLYIMASIVLSPHVGTLIV